MEDISEMVSNLRNSGLHHFSLFAVTSIVVPSCHLVEDLHNVVMRVPSLGRHFGRDWGCGSVTKSVIVLLW